MNTIDYAIVGIAIVTAMNFLLLISLVVQNDKASKFLAELIGSAFVYIAFIIGAAIVGSILILIIF